MKEHIIITFSGILIAIIAAFLTYFLGRFRENKKSETTYYKTFEIIDASFDWNISQLNRLEKSLVQLKETSLSTKNILIDEFPTNFNSTIIQASVDKLITYKKSDVKLIKLLIFYSNHLEELNYQLRFNSLNKTIKNLEKAKIEGSIKDYFESIQVEYIDKLKMEIEICRSMMKNAR